MTKLNALGRTLLECKEEYLNTHSDLVKNALRVYAQDLATASTLDPSILTCIQDTNLKLDAFKEFLLEKSQCCISLDEILKEFDDKKETFMDNFEKKPTISCSIDEDNTSISFSVALEIGEEFVSNYFGVDQNETFNLMQRQGFVEKFTALRVRKLAQEIVAATSNKKPLHIETDISYAYFVTEENIYAVDVVLTLSAEHIFEKEQENIAFIKEIQEIIQATQKKYLSC